jgi:glycosyltransferase involved in cell wall biosynthesis
MLFTLSHNRSRDAEQSTQPRHPSIVCVGSEWFPLKPGGLSRYVYELIRELLANNDQVEFCGVDLIDLVIAKHSSQELPDESLMLSEKLSLTHLAQSAHPLIWKVIAGHRIAKRINWQRVDAVNLHFSLYSLPLLSCIPSHVPITFHFHGPWALESQWEGDRRLSIQMKRLIERYVYQRCDRFITLSHAFARILHTEYQVPMAKIHVIPGGINTAHFNITLSRLQARTMLGLPLDRPLLFSPRRLVQRVGIDKLLDALAIVQQQVPDVLSLIAGKGDQREALEQQVDRLHLRNNVQFLGYVPDVQLPIYYQAADLTVVPSQSLEGFGLVLLESLACGTPVLSTPVGGMPEVLHSLDPNLITAGVDSTAIAQRLSEFLTGQLRLLDRQTCRDHVVAQYDWQIIARQVREVVIAPKGGCIDP